MTDRDLPMMPWFPRDFAAATAGWTFLEKSVYRPLLDSEWMVGSLPVDEGRLLLIVGCSEAQFATAWPMVKTKFVLAKLDTGETVYHNLRLEDHRTESMRLKGRRSESASHAARTRWRKESAADALRMPDASAPHAPRMPDAMRTACPPIFSSEEKMDSKNPNLRSEDSSADALARAPRGPVDKALEITADWQPNEINREWLVESGMTAQRITEVIAEFVGWARHTKLRKSSRNWQLSFYRNPRVKSAIGTSRSRGTSHGAHQGSSEKGRETAYDRAGRRLREWAGDVGLDESVLG